jgi:murein DD-endopeptidase MepM/ murein hydrolase activator NlpD
VRIVTSFFTQKSILPFALILFLPFVASCKQTVRLGSGPLPAEQGTIGAAPTVTPVVPVATVTIVPGTVRPLATPTCCNFPIKVFPSGYPFNDGSERSFGSGREGGARTHAAADLYFEVGQPIYAVDDGTVLDTYFFYSETYALEVQHPNFIIRYGEIRQKLAPGVAVGSKVKAGQIIAYVGQMYCCRPMLHFEMFSGKSKGTLTDTSRPPYYRRSDLINPTTQLLDWKKRLPK